MWSFAAAKESLILIWISMIPGIVLLIYRLPLYMGTREKFLNENAVHFIYGEFTLFVQEAN